MLQVLDDFGALFFERTDLMRDDWLGREPARQGYSVLPSPCQCFKPIKMKRSCWVIFA
jgi:hypothetical protein